MGSQIPEPVLGTVALAYPGFFAGIAAFATALLLVRVARMKGKFSVRPPAEFWADPDHRLLILQLSLLYSAILLGILYFSAPRVYITQYAFLGVIVVMFGLFVRRDLRRKREERRRRHAGREETSHS